ncbi:MAG: hypothetical protein K6E94_04110 [Elusimicrobiaceae bacterium]|nr:hypothetical protein [Elusimicrobiaceae bacterium]
MKNKSIFAREILITVFLIILLSILCVKKIKDLKILAQSSITQKNEQILQEALAVYRGDNEGLCPIHLEALKGEYLENIPPNFSNGEENNSIKEGTNIEDIFDGTGGWLYINSIDKKSCEVIANIKE